MCSVSFTIAILPKVAPAMQRIGMSMRVHPRNRIEGLKRSHRTWSYKQSSALPRTSVQSVSIVVACVARMRDKLSARQAAVAHSSQSISSKSQHAKVA